MTVYPTTRILSSLLCPVSASWRGGQRSHRGWTGGEGVEKWGGGVGGVCVCVCVCEVPECGRLLGAREPSIRS